MTFLLDFRRYVQSLLPVGPERLRLPSKVDPSAVVATGRRLARRGVHPVGVRTPLLPVPRKPVRVVAEPRRDPLKLAKKPSALTHVALAIPGSPYDGSATQTPGAPGHTPCGRRSASSASSRDLSPRSPLPPGGGRVLMKRGAWDPYAPTHGNVGTRSPARRS